MAHAIFAVDLVGKQGTRHSKKKTQPTKENQKNTEQFIMATNLYPVAPSQMEPQRP